MIDKRGFLQIALDIHMTCNGSYERSNEENDKDVRVLSEHLDNWEPSISSVVPFDNACKWVMQMALVENEHYQWKEEKG